MLRRGLDPQATRGPGGLFAPHYGAWTARLFGLLTSNFVPVVYSSKLALLPVLGQRVRPGLPVAAVSSAEGQGTRAPSSFSSG